MYQCVFFGHLHTFLRRPWVLSRALGCGARRGPACRQRRNFAFRACPVARAPGVQSCEIWQVITGLLSAELERSKTMGNLHAGCFAPHCRKEQQQGNNNRFKRSSVLHLRTLLYVCGPLLCVCGHDVCVHVLCVLSVHVYTYLRVCPCVTHASTRSSRVGKDTYMYAYFHLHICT